MPGSWCVVNSCGNSSYRARKEGRTDLSFHSFPKDVRMRAIWIQKCNRSRDWDPSASYICSDHFRQSDFKRNLQAELMGYKVRQRKLSDDAIPSHRLGRMKTTPKLSDTDEDPDYFPGIETRKIQTYSYYDDIKPLKLKKEKKKRKVSEFVVLPRQVLERTIKAAQKLNDENDLFGEVVANEFRAIKSLELKEKLRFKTEELILNTMLEEENDC